MSEILVRSLPEYMLTTEILGRLNFVPWHKREKVFLKRCRDSWNAEALYRKGMINCFSRRKHEPGMHYLKKAVEKGHVEATYAYGIISICLGGELKDRGLQVLSSLNITSCSKRSFKIESCRLKTNKLLSNMWVKVCLSSPTKYSINSEKLIDCCNCEHDMTPRLNRLNSIDQTWEASNNLADNLPCCESCFWDREAALFCNMLKKKLVN